MAHTKQALARGYAVVAIDAIDPSRCFGIHADQAAVVTILKAFLKRPYQGNQTLEVGGGAVQGGARWLCREDACKDAV